MNTYGAVDHDMHPSPAQTHLLLLFGRPNRTGHWDEAEHDLFLHGVKLYGRTWSKVAKVVGTRTTIQARTHAQKYFAKKARDQERDTAKRMGI